ncbi:transcriptional regulator [Streptomyces sp. NBC_01601]|uniref:transcriptional regulator n=1 Tax=Streptomyces sp. NBC_01601 TaxID=2975892 RepID=UPI002E29D931|nr:transcriptional regulator [Streptomyces sp. NBC_01601]
MLTTIAPPAPRPTTATDADERRFRVPDGAQWMATTDSRIAPSAEAWFEAVYWFYKYGPYAADRSHGPQKVGRTTLRLALVLARLTECRPSVDVLVSWLKVSERTVQYHLGILRETGLLTYLSKGTRVSGVGGRATEFQRTIPPLFDTAAGVRTGPSDTLIRSVRGYCEDRIPLLKELHTEARRLLNPKRTKSANRRRGRGTSNTPPCTPRVVGTSSSSSAGDTYSPSESKLEDGQRKSPTPKKTKPTRRSGNHVARRYRLAAELIHQIGWLNRASVPRIAWVIRHVADAGWSTTEVIAFLGQEAPARHVRRPSGFLASRLSSAHRRYDTPAKRAAIVDWWRDSRRAEQDRHAEWEGDWQRPTSHAVTRQVEAAFAQLQQPAAAPDDHRELAVGEDGLVDLEQLSRDEVIELRAAALKDPALVRATIDTCGEGFARRLFTHHLVETIQRTTRLGRTVIHQWRPA